MPTSFRLTKNLRSFLLLLAASFLIFSCKDSGCIDADDFGEYESQTVTVSANAQQENCSYDSSVSITDSTQGSGIKSCLTTGEVTVGNENGGSMTSETAGCSGLDNATFQNICINNCIQSCLSSVGSSNSSGAEPSWTSTDEKGGGQNSGVTIRPGSQVIVRAIGNVELGNSVEYPDLFLKANDPIPHSYNSTWQNRVFDARDGQSLVLSFSGLAYASDANTVPTVKLGETNAESDLYNLAKKLVIYTIKHPQGYGGFDTTKFTEREGSRKVPLLPDEKAWKCSYNGPDPLQASCGNSSYVSLGYANVDDVLTNAAFPISADSKSPNLTKSGGIIRWSGDGLRDSDFDPFSGVTCDSTGSCPNINGVAVKDGILLGDISSGDVSIQNTYNDAYAVSFRSLTGDASCNSGTENDLVVSVKDSSNNQLDKFNAVSIGNSWTTDEINLEAGHKLVINQNANFHNVAGINCGRMIGIRFLKHHDLIMDQSGFVRFFILGGDSGSASGSCNIKGRIINPTGSHTNFNADTTTYYEADFYEYGTRDSSTSQDPLQTLLSVNASLNGSPEFSPGESATTNQVFVRKGQKIRLYPESWIGVWSTGNSLSRKCGVGMAMKIIPRPALLCRGSVLELVSNPDCSPQLGSNGSLLGCQAIASECYDPNAPQYCPHNECIDTITCTENASNNYARDCSRPSPSKADRAECNDALINVTDPNAKDKCRSCSDLMLAHGEAPALQTVNNIAQCYDLENYTGKVANIPSIPDSIEEVKNFLENSKLSKNATKLGGFNGKYGNISGFSDSGQTSVGGKKVYNANTTYSVSGDSRIKTLILDGENFVDSTNNGAWTAYADNTNPSGSYNGSNGIEIGFSGSLSFKNGQWMQVRLCKESDSDSSLCKSISAPPNFASTNNQPQIINISSPSNPDLVGTLPDTLYGDSNYNFDSSGNLYRVNSANVSGDCTLAANGLQTGAGSTFYCHTYNYYSAASLKNKNENEKEGINNENKKLRLTFKILDPEIGNCTLIEANDGIKTTNPYYNSSVASNIGLTCESSETPGDDSSNHPGTCAKQYYCASKYSNNSGEYYVNVKVKSDSTVAVSSIISSVITPVLEVMDGKRDNPSTEEDESTIGQAERVYKLLIADTRYKAILTVCLVVMLTFYGVGYLLGVSELNHAEIFNRVIKIGFIYLMVGETGWDWFQMFFVRFFKEGTDYLSFMMASSFDDSPEISQALDSGDLYDKSVLFSSVDNVLNLFFAPAVQKKLSALLFASIFGWAYLLIIWWSFIHYMYAIASAVLLYLTAQVFISILFVVGPIFFIFMLFNQTKEMFDNWVKQLIGFSLQQILLLITLAFFNMLMYEVIKMSLGYKVCWDEVWVMNLGITRISLMSFWTIASLPPRTNANSQVGNIGNPEGIPSIFTILFIWVIASLMEQFIDFMTKVAAVISGGLKTTEMSAGIKQTAEEFKKAVVDPVTNRIYGETAGRALSFLDDKIFDSGGGADKRRSDEEKKGISDREHENAMLEAGKNAAKEFRKANPFMEDGPEKDKQAVKAVEDAMKQEARRRGVTSAAEIERLMSNKGPKTAGAKTVFGSLYKQFRGSNTLTKSLGEMAKETSGRASTGELRAAMKRMNPEERAKVNEGLANGQISTREPTSTLSSYLSKRSIGAGAKSVINTPFQMIDPNMDFVGSVKSASGLDSSEKRDAKQQLEKEGTASGRLGGMEFSRPKDEKDLVGQRSSQNKREQKFAIPPAPKLEKAAGLLRKSDHLKTLEEIDERRDIGDGYKALKKASASLGNFLKEVNPWSESRERYKQQAAAQRSGADILAERVNKVGEVNTKELSVLKAARESAMIALDQSGQAVKTQQNKIKGLRDNYNKLKVDASRLADPDQKKRREEEASRAFSEMRYEESRLAKSQELKEFRERTAAVHQIDTKISNQEALGAKIDEARGTINRAKEIEARASGNNSENIKSAFTKARSLEDLEKFAKKYSTE
ncbi:MAG: type IV secretion system protein [Proteobacteria bacterium]|nr:type IV secretion system protein [Pseudomonadota bacterium]